MHEAEQTVFVVDDDPSIRESLSFLLGSVDRTAETYSSAVRFLEVYDEERPGCLVLDIRMPGMSGLDLHKRLESMGSTLPVIFITAHGDVPMAVRAMKTGAVDFVQKPFREQEFLDRIEKALEENRNRREESANRHELSDRISSLTPRERQVMAMVTEGLANKVIASDLGVSERTVEIHRAKVMRKMQASSLPDLVRMTVSLEP